MNLIASGPSFRANPAFLGRVCLLQFSPESHIDHVELQTFVFVGTSFTHSNVRHFSVLKCL